MTDEIQIKDLFLRTILGINEEERAKRQDILVNIILYADTRWAGASDDVDDALNYRTVTKRVIRLVEGSRFYLVEKMAAEIAATCLRDPRVERVRVRVEKPGALRFSRSVGVEIERGRADLEPPTHRVFVVLGSNIEPEHHLREAVQRLGERCDLIAVSPVYRTTPVGQRDQPDFLNAAVLIATPLTPAQLKKEVLLAIEEDLGRDRSGDRYGPRTIDLDIALYDDAVFDLRGRHVPDPDIPKHIHVARPLARLAPDHIHPETGETLAQIAADLPDEGIERADITL